MVWLLFASLTMAHARSAVAQADSGQSGGQVSVSLLTPAQMSAPDAQLAAARQAGIARSALLYGYKLDSSYNYRQIACPFAPRYTMLAYEAVYEAVGPEASVSRFAAVFRRDPERGTASSHSEIQIVPIARSGVVPFVSASANPHSFAVFNRAVTNAPVGGAAIAEIDAGKDPILLRSLCFLAMIGGPSTISLAPSLDMATVQAPVPTLQFVEEGKFRQVLSVRTSAIAYQVWSLTFSPNGQLIAAEREERATATPSPTLNASAASPTAPPPLSREPGPAANTSAAQSSVAPPGSESMASAVRVETEAPPSSAPPAAAVAATSALPQPPRRFIPNPPPPPSRTIPNSVMRTPPQIPEP